MLQFQSVSVAYGPGKPALSDFSLVMEPGEIVALVGESGSGKTTALRAAMGLLPGGGQVVEGDIRFEGESLLGLSAPRWRSLRGKDIAMIFQDSGAMLNPIRTIGSQFTEYIRAHQPLSQQDAWSMAQQMLERMGLPHSGTVMASYPFQLSGGMCQRVGIAMTMVFHPRLLLADEPTAALDTTMQAQVARQMLELRGQYQTSILLVTHNLGIAAYMADRIFVLSNGYVVESGSRQAILTDAKDSYTRCLLEAVPKMKGERYV